MDDLALSSEDTCEFRGAGPRCYSRRRPQRRRVSEAACLVFTLAAGGCDASVVNQPRRCSRRPLSVLAPEAGGGGETAGCRRIRWDGFRGPSERHRFAPSSPLQPHIMNFQPTH